MVQLNVAQTFAQSCPDGPQRGSDGRTANLQPAQSTAEPLDARNKIDAQDVADLHLQNLQLSPTCRKESA